MRVDTQQPTPPSVPTQMPTTALYSVVRVVDGDTISVNIDGVSKTLRLIGIDTPEVVDPRKPVQCFGREASDRAKALLNGKQVRLETDATQGEFDKYGRTLAYVFLKDGTNFNELMIEEGYAHEYTYNVPYRYQAEFKSAETDARDHERGLWAPGACGATTLSAENSPNAVPASPALVSGGQYTCETNAYNCSDFKTQADAQAVFQACGGDANDVHHLDSDRDGKVCESLP